MPELSLAKKSSARSQKVEFSADQIKAVRQLVGHTVAEVMCELIIETLANQRGSRTEAAKLLGISIRTLRNKIHEYDGRGKSVPKPGRGHCTPRSATRIEASGSRGFTRMSRSTTVPQASQAMISQ